MGVNRTTVLSIGELSGGRPGPDHVILASLEGTQTQLIVASGFATDPFSRRACANTANRRWISEPCHRRRHTPRKAPARAERSAQTNGSVALASGEPVSAA